jgi:hypothetical protein
MSHTLAKVVRKVSEALALDNVAAKTERLLALWEETNRFLRPVQEKSYFEKSETAGKVCAVAATGTVGGFVMAFLIPPLAMIALLVAGGCGFLSLGSLYARHVFRDKMMQEYYEPPKPEAVKAEANREKALIVKTAIEQTIAMMLEDAPREVKKSPRFHKSARAAFNAVSKDDAFDTLVAFNGLVTEAKQKRGFLTRA